MKTDASPPDDDYTGIHFFNTSGSSLPIDQSKAQAIAQTVEEHESCSFRFIEIVFVDEEEILKINHEHLDHDYVTDIITFRYDDAESADSIEGTLYCCGPRIREQADEFGQPVQDEFKRIIIHGLLHLAGYDDKSDDARQAMRHREAYYLQQI